MQKNYTLSICSENSPGVLQRLAVLFTRRKMNIESLTVSETEKKGISRFTLVINTEPDLIRTVAKQVNRIIEVVDVFVSENSDLVFKEIAFYKLTAETPERRGQIEDVAHRYGAVVAQARGTHIVVEKTGTEEEISSLFLLLEPFGIKEFVRSGRIAILNRDREVGEMFPGFDETPRLDRSVDNLP